MSDLRFALRKLRQSPAFGSIAVITIAAQLYYILVQNPTLPKVVGDPLLLQQAFLNILINAEHAIAGQDGERRIEVSTSFVDPAQALRAD